MTRNAVETALTYFYLDVTTEREKTVTRQAIHSMNPRYQRLFNLKYGELCSWEECARQMHTPAGTLRNWHNRALDILGEILEESGNVYEDTAHC